MSKLDFRPASRAKSLSRFKFSLQPEKNENIKTSRIPSVTPTASVSHINQPKTVLPKPKTQFKTHTPPYVPMV